MSLLSPAFTPVETPPVATPAGSSAQPSRLAATKPTAPVVGAKYSLPDGTQLRLSISRKVILSALFDRQEIDESGNLTGKVISWTQPTNPMEDLVVIFLAGTNPEVWYQAVPGDDGVMVMLYQHPSEFMRTVAEWADGNCLSEMTPTEVYAHVKALWTGEHANFTVPVETEKKTVMTETLTPSPSTGYTSTPASSPAETPANSTTSSTNSP